MAPKHAFTLDENSNLVLNGETLDVEDVRVNVLPNGALKPDARIFFSLDEDTALLCYFFIGRVDQEGELQVERELCITFDDEIDLEAFGGFELSEEVADFLIQAHDGFIHVLYSAVASTCKFTIELFPGFNPDAHLVLALPGQIVSTTVPFHKLTPYVRFESATQSVAAMN